MKTRDQVRAERASSLVASLKPEQLEEYGAEVRGLPVLVVQNGLGSTLAHLKSKGGAAKTSVYEHVSNWVSETIYGEPKGDLLSLVVAHQASRLMRAQDETLAFCAWLRRFAEAKDPKARKP